MLRSIPLNPALIISLVCQMIYLHLCLSTKPISDFTACSLFCLILSDVIIYNNFCYMKFLITQSSTDPPPPQYSQSPQRPVHKHPKKCSSTHMVRHPRCVFINYNWINQLSNTTIWWLDICCLLHRYQLHVSTLMAISS